MKKLRIHALADVDPQRLSACAQGRAQVKTYPSPEGLVEDPDVDVVFIGVPTRFHCELFLMAVRAGKAVYVEKPLALDVEDAMRMREAARNARGKVVHGLNMRSHRLARRAKACTEEGRLGAIRAIRSVIVGSSIARSPWQLDPREGGGPVFEVAIHHLDLWRWLGGAAIGHVEAAGDASRKVTVAGELANGVAVSGLFSFEGADTNEMEVIGDRGAIRFSFYQADSWSVRPQGRMSQAARWLRDLPEAAQVARRKGDYLDSYRVHWARFAEGESVATVDDGVAAVEAVHAVLRSLERKAA